MRRPTQLLAAAAALTLALAGCSDSDAGDTAAPVTTTTSGAPTADAVTCEPVAGDELVALEDDLQLQNADAIVPVVRTEVLTDPLRTALDAVSAALSQEALIALNAATDLDRVPSEQAAADFVAAEGLAEGLSGGSGPVRVVAANFTENLTLANVYAAVLDAAGFDASVEQLSNRELYSAALQAGEVDLVPEYAATATEFYNVAANGQDAEPLASGDAAETVEALNTLVEPLGLTALTAAEATDQNAFAVTTAFAEEYGVSTLSELAAACGGGVSLGGPPECPERPFCQPGLEETYGLTVSEFTSLDAGGPLTKNALTTGVIGLGLVFTSDASLVTG